MRRVFAVSLHCRVPTAAGGPFLLRLLTVITIIAAIALASVPAQANSKYAGFVIDANTGKTLYASSADAPRYPASLTKMMTLYMIFDAMKSGKMSKKTRIRVSREAASRPPSKIGLKPGQTISAEQAIYALVTKSANDVAAAVGEHFAGTEAKFGQMMTRKARQIGLRKTTFRNASGLPNSRQKTTARDMAKLGIALQEHFPEHFRYFKTRSFTYKGRRYGNHNRLLGRVRGVNGIKTGYTRASGFNLVSSVNHKGRRIVAVVMGGRTGASRNAHMTKLINRYLPKASKRNRGPLLAARKGGTQVVAQALPVKSAPLPTTSPRRAPERVIAQAAPVTASAASARTAYAPSAKPAPRPSEALPKADIDPITTASPKPSGWVIQVASLPTQTEANSVIAKTKKKAGRVLASAQGFTEVFEKDSTTFYRARFGGFGSKSAAWRACAALKKKRIACYAVAS